MNPQRIEEFRRKLREGRPVRVVGGQVTIDGANGKPMPGETPWPLASPGGAVRGPASAEAPEGVYVKPHDWGALSSAPLFGTPAGERRALTEQILLDREYPGFVLDVDDDGMLFAHGHLGPTTTLRGRYHVLVELPPGYGEA